jgi:hypothetical protein
MTTSWPPGGPRIPAAQAPGPGAGSAAGTGHQHPRRRAASPGPSRLSLVTRTSTGAAAGQPRAAVASGTGLTPLARLEVEQARRYIETLPDRTRGADLADAMFILGELSRHAQLLLDVADALTLT